MLDVHYSDIESLACYGDLAHQMTPLDSYHLAGQEDLVSEWNHYHFRYLFYGKKVNNSILVQSPDLQIQRSNLSTDKIILYVSESFDMFEYRFGSIFIAIDILFLTY